ncbi:2-haloalkanoic acid dehalogenase-like protein [Coleophoma crateriformis]|uniref:2-haloalkanoic acid dehalogenase-like protein n=1 Tax=Coleophoma crateriformis TaxID=565419 RepID=A0A3D8QIL6_9HELO|nr:2-haloalkanoic acid dehalogenase-like protein [Coleophoma crateriformis]
MGGQKQVVFDIVGTLVSFDAYHAQIDKAIGAKLRANSITPKFFGYSWMTAAELEFTFLSISERYKPYKGILESTFYRTLWLAGVQDPRALCTDEERDACVQGYSELELRPGAKECFEILKKGGFKVWLLTTADLKRVQGYFEKGGVDMPAENFISCDSSGVAKPALAAYRTALSKFAADDETWFAAAHMWDVSAAKKVGFKGAYCTVYEKEPCLEIFDTEMDVMADSLSEMAEKIVKAASS